ncbi:MAG: HAMP domain-containing protein, partial [Anaerotignum sp.]|nr:HAMP domain-containing protein [Anaerotignum sp.]
MEPIALSLYEKDDREHVGWFWEPYEAGQAVWMMPYHNQNNGIWMVSYVVPLYWDDQFIGVVGMDFDYAVLIDRVHEIRIYENGFAHLEVEDMIIHHDDLEADIDVSDLPGEYLQVSEELANGMKLVLSASYDDMKQIRYDIAYKILFAMLLLVAVFSFIVFLVVRRIVDPLKKLTEASKKLSNGDYDVEIIDSDTYEIKLLSTAFENMTKHLREHEKHQRMLAYRDSLTGLRNTTAYNGWVTDFEKD